MTGEVGGPAWLWIGLESGPALIGPIGAGGKVVYDAVGEVVAVAAKLQSLAEPGTALVGPATRAAVEHLFTWGPRVPVTSMAGGQGASAVPAGAPGQTAAALTASYLVEPIVRAGQPRAGACGPLVGRTAEVAALDAALREAVRGRGSVLVLRGEPGLGKKRLVQETRRRFLAWAGAREGRLPLWLAGQAASYASATPYGVYQQLLAGWLGVAPDQPRPVVRAALEHALSELMASTELLPLLEHVMGLAPSVAATGGRGGRDELAGEELRQAAFEALRTVISRLAPSRRPAVIVLEDLHWADSTSLRFTRELIPLAARRPLLILATTRPLLEAFGDPTRQYGFYEALAMQRVERAGLRSDEQAIADMRRSLAAAEASRDAKDTGYATYSSSAGCCGCTATWRRRAAGSARPGGSANGSARRCCWPTAWAACPWSR